MNTLPVFVKLLPDSRLWEGYGLYLAIPAVEGREEKEEDREREGSGEVVHVNVWRELIWCLHR